MADDTTPGLADDDTASRLPGESRVRQLVAAASKHPLRVIVVAAIAVFAIVGIGRPLIGTQVFDGADLLMQYAPWRDSAPANFVAQRPCVSDTVDSVLPTTAEFRRRLLHGDFAKWNPYAAGGAPLGSVPSYAVFSPLSVPALVLPPWLSPAYVKLLEIFVGVLGTYLFLRQISLVRSAALLGGLLFVSSGFLVTWTNWPQSRTATFIPWLFWAIERFVRRHTLAAAVPIALVFACMVLGGFPAVTGYALYAAVPYLALRAISLSNASPRRWLDAGARTALALVFVGLGAALAAFQLLPFVTQLNALGLSRPQSPSVHLPMLSLVTAAVPTVFGACGVRSPYISTIGDVEANAFIGATALVLAGVALLRGPSSFVPRGVRGYFVGATAITVVLGWWGHLPLRLAQNLPVFSNNPVFRIRCVFGFFVAVLAAIGYDRLVRSPMPRMRGRGLLEAAGWGLAAAIAVAALVQVDHTYSGRPTYSRHPMIMPLVIGGLAFVIVAALGFRRVSDRPRLRTVLLAILPVLVVVESTTFAAGFWPRTKRDQFYPDTSVHKYIAAHDQGDARYIGTGVTMFPGTNVYYGLSTPNGHVFTNPAWTELLKTVDPSVARTQTFTAFSWHLTAARIASPILDRLAVRFVVTDPDGEVFGTHERLARATGNTTLQPKQGVDVALPPGPLRAVGVDATRLDQVTSPAWLNVDVLDEAGHVLLHNRRRIEPAKPGNFLVALAGESLDLRPHVARLTLEATRGPIAIGAVDSVPVLTIVRPAADGLRLVYAAGATVWQRDRALPRIRWASNNVVAPDWHTRLTFLANREAPDTVVLDRPAPPASGKPARVRVLSKSNDGIRIRVDAQGAGYLVVADALTNGWVATVDGHRVPLVNADHAMVAVRVAGGSHDIRLRYEPAHQRAGFALSTLTVVLLGAVTIGPRRARRRRRNRDTRDRRPGVLG